MEGGIQGDSAPGPNPFNIYHQCLSGKVIPDQSCTSQPHRISSMSAGGGGRGYTKPERFEKEVFKSTVK